MVFSSISFLYYFLPLTIISYFLANDRHKNTILLAASLLFYTFGEVRYIPLILIGSLIGYIYGILIDKVKDIHSKRLLTFSAMFINVSILCFFKYSNFIISNINSMIHLNIKPINIDLPVGISFYTFQILSYIIDVYRVDIKACKNFKDFTTYVCLFPQLIAGPIVRYSSIQEELKKRKHSFEKFSYGTNRFILGLSKKVILANNLGELVSILENSKEQSFLGCWIIAVAYSLQIYHDFSAYSDMAIGLGMMLGFKFPENFNYPYIARNITDFWRRWHISLSSFFKEYVYIPLGGNKVRTWRWILNISIVWALTGLWHGASWNFVLWGLYFGAILVIEKLLLNKILDNLPIILQHLYSKLLIIVSFVLFKYEDIQTLSKNLYYMFNPHILTFTNKYTIYYTQSFLVLLIISIFAATPAFKKVISKLYTFRYGEIFCDLINPFINILLLIVSTAFIIDGSFNPFLYFRF